MDFHYRPQRSCGQGNIFAPVCHSVHRGSSASVYAGIPYPPGADTPESRHPPGADTHPRSRHPLGADPLLGADTPPEQTPPRSRHPPPRSRHPPPREVDSGIRSMSGRYASYWNLFQEFICKAEDRPISNKFWELHFFPFWIDHNRHRIGSSALQFACLIKQELEISRNERIPLAGLCGLLLLPPATKLGQGSIFSSACQEFCSQGEYLGRYPRQIHSRAGTTP